MQELVFLTFARRYMNSFTKASSLSEQVTIRLSSEAELPVVIEYNKIAEKTDGLACRLVACF